MKSQLTRQIMIGIAEIAEGSGVGQRRVREWIRSGAPIWKDETSGRWLSYAPELWEWRKRYDLKKLSIGS